MTEASTILQDIEAMGAVMAAQLEHDQNIRELCRDMALAICDQAQYQAMASKMDTADLVYEFALVDRVFDRLNDTDGPKAKWAAGHVAKLRDVLAAEGFRRGSILHVGDDFETLLLSIDVVRQIIDTDIWQPEDGDW